MNFCKIPYMKNIQIIVFLLAGVYFFPSLQGKGISRKEKVNVIFILADDLGYECLGCDGGLSYQTPNLNKMAAEGMRFTHCYSQPLCTPSRVKLMTGKYNYRNYEGFEYLNPKERTFGNVMKEAGYKTCITGKWQLNGNNGNGTDHKSWPGSDDKNRPHTFGFEEYCLWQLTARESRYSNPLIEQNGKTLTGLENSYGPDIFCQYALDFIDRNKKENFFLYYPMVLPHSPFSPTPDSEEWTDPSKRNVQKNSYFGGMVNYLDKIVGKIIKKVNESGISDHTLIIFAGDNGTNSRIISFTREGEYKGGKGKTFDPGTHVPLILWWPGKIKAASVYEGLIDFSDFMPTFAEIAGITTESDGKSFYPLLVQRPYSPKEAIFEHYDLRLGPGKSSYHDRFARTKEYKLYQDGRFFHIPTDRLEEDPLPEGGKFSWEVMQIRSRLQVILDEAPEWKF